MRVGAPGTEEGDPDRLLHRHRRTHDLAKDGANRVVWEDARSSREQPPKDRLLPLGGDRAHALGGSDAGDDVGAAAKQVEKLVVDDVDRGAKLVEILLGHAPTLEASSPREQAGPVPTPRARALQGERQEPNGFRPRRSRSVGHRREVARRQPWLSPLVRGSSADDAVAFRA